MRKVPGFVVFSKIFVIFSVLLSSESAFAQDNEVVDTADVSIGDHPNCCCVHDVESGLSIRGNLPGFRIWLTGLIAESFFGGLSIGTASMGIASYVEDESRLFFTSMFISLGSLALFAGIGLVLEAIGRHRMRASLREERARTSS